MDDIISSELSDAVEKQSDLTSIANDSYDVDHALVLEEFNIFARNNPDVENLTNEQLQHGLGRYVHAKNQIRGTICVNFVWLFVAISSLN